MLLTCKLVALSNTFDGENLFCLQHSSYTIKFHIRAKSKPIILIF